MVADCYWPANRLLTPPLRTHFIWQMESRIGMSRYTVNNNDLRNTYLLVGALTVLLFIALYTLSATGGMEPLERIILTMPWVLSSAYLIYSIVDVYIWRAFSRMGLFKTPSLNGVYSGKCWTSDSSYSESHDVTVNIQQSLSEVSVEMVTIKEGKKESFENVTASIISRPYNSYIYYPFSSPFGNEDEMKPIHEGFCALEFDGERYHVKGRYFTDNGGKIGDGVLSLERAVKTGDASIADANIPKRAVLRPPISRPVKNKERKKLETSRSYSEKILLEDKPEPISETYSLLRERILELDEDIEILPFKHHLSFVAMSPFVDVQVQKTQIKIWLNISIGELDDPKGAARDVSDVKHWGNGEYEVIIKPGDDLDYVMMLIKQSYCRNNL